MANSDRRVIQAKRELRQSIRAARAARWPEDIDAHGMAVVPRLLTAYDNAATSSGRIGLIGYLPMPTEPSPVAAMVAAHERGIPVWVPVVLSGNQLGFAPWSPGIRTTTHPTFAIEEPSEGVQEAGAVRNAALMIVPALAATRSGVRLGQGGGYYDRLFEKWDALDSGGPGGEADVASTNLGSTTSAARGRPRATALPRGPMRVGLVFPEEVVTEGVIPSEPHDARLDAVIA